MQISGVLQLNHLAWNGEMSPLKQNIDLRSNCGGKMDKCAHWAVAPCFVLYFAAFVQINTSYSPFSWTRRTANSKGKNSEDITSFLDVLNLKYRVDVRVHHFTINYWYFCPCSTERGDKS